MANNQEEVEYVTFGDGCSDAKLLEIFKEIPFDMQLISSNNEKVSAHYAVLAMFSSHFRNYFNEKPFIPGMEGKFRFLHFILHFIFNSFFNCHFLFCLNQFQLKIFQPIS